RGRAAAARRIAAAARILAERTRPGHRGGAGHPGQARALRPGAVLLVAAVRRADADGGRCGMRRRLGGARTRWPAPDAYRAGRWWPPVVRAGHQCAARLAVLAAAYRRGDAAGSRRPGRSVDPA